MTPIQEIKLGFEQRLKSGVNVLSEIVSHRGEEKSHFSLSFTMTRSVVDFKYSNQGFSNFSGCQIATMGFIASRHTLKCC